jgi:hypothetical protein
MDLDEEELARLNQEYMESKRTASSVTEPQAPPLRPRKMPRASFCCAPMILAIGLIALVAFYITSGAYGSKGDDTADALEKLNKEIIPKAKEELKKSLDQGENLYNETQGNVKNLTDQYDETKELIDDAGKIYTEIKK